MLPLGEADGVAVTVTCPDFPLGIVSAAGEAVKDEFCGAPPPVLAAAGQVGL